MSSHNPFRTPTVTPQPTGASATSSTQALTSSHIPHVTPQHSDTYYPPPAGPLPPTTSQNSSTSQLGQLDTDLPAPSISISEEAPPAYTPTPDINVGETTVDIGPRRPFQQAPSLPPPQQQPYFTGALYPNPPHPHPHPHPQSHSQWAPPPMHPLSRNSTGTSVALAPPALSRRRSGSDVHASAAPASPTTPLSDFARDFYAAGAGAPGADAESTSTNGASASGPRYAPPPGDPPARRPTTTSPRAGRSEIAQENDGRPTQTPVPGHPLLNKGQVLVYPAGHECTKCKQPPPSSYLFRFRWRSKSQQNCPFDRGRFSHTRVFVSRRQEYGVQELRPLAPVPQVLGKARQAFHRRAGLHALGPHLRLHLRVLEQAADVPAALAHVQAAAVLRRFLVAPRRSSPARRVSTTSYR